MCNSDTSVDVLANSDTDTKVIVSNIVTLKSANTNTHSRDDDNVAFPFLNYCFLSSFFTLCMIPLLCKYVDDELFILVFL